MSLYSELVILSLYTTKLKRVKKLEHSFLKELLFKEEVLLIQKLLLFVKCQVLLELSVSSQLTCQLYKKLKSTKKVQFVELEFSTSENLLVKKLKLKTKEDSFLSLYYKKSPTMLGIFFWNKLKI